MEKGCYEMKKYKNISGKKLEVAGHRVCNNHLFELEDDVDITDLVKDCLVKVI